MAGTAPATRMSDRANPEEMPVQHDKCVALAVIGGCVSSAAFWVHGLWLGTSAEEDEPPETNMVMEYLETVNTVERQEQRDMIAFQTLLAVRALDEPYCPEEDSCHPEYENGQWEIVEDK